MRTGWLRVGFDTEFEREGAADVATVEAAEAISDAVLRGNQTLCYSTAFQNADTGARDEGIIELEPGEGGAKHRLALTTFLGSVIDEAIKAGVLDAEACRTRVPGEKRGPTLRIDMVAHFTRADLCGFRDWKTLRKAFDSVRGTFVTTTTPIVRTVWRENGMPVVCSIRLYDSMLLAPATHQSLDKLGSLLGKAKLELPLGYTKDRMSVFRHDHPEAFRAYALRDADIALNWLISQTEFLSEEFHLNAEKIPPTLGAAGVQVFRAMCTADGVSLQDFLGGKTENEMFLAYPQIQDHLALIANSYHGGRNEAYWVGPTPQGIILDWDLKGAYTAAMAGIPMPDWGAAEVTTDLERLAMVDTAMTYARVRFRFPPRTRYPSLPVRAGGGRGLIYPLSGETHVTGPELVVAQRQGAEIEVLTGLAVPFIAGDERRPFAAFSRRIAEVRAKHKGVDPAREKTAKEMGNSGYGKTAQSVDAMRTTGTGARNGKKVFDARTGNTVSLPASAITSPALAAWITGMVRAACSELAAAIPDHRTIYTLTTDGFLTDATREELDTTGPVAQAFSRMREIVAGDPEVLELKHGAAQCIIVKTRGTFTSKPLDDHEPVIARAGQRLEETPPDILAESSAWVDIYRKRTYDLAHTRSQLISLRDQWKHVADLIAVSRTVQVNLEFDHKRRIVAPRDRDGLLSADTLPWRSLEEFEAYRSAFDTWRKSKRACCVTREDFRAFEQWRETRGDKATAGMTDKGEHPPLVRSFLRAWSAKAHGLPRGTNRELAELTSKWWPTTANAVKTAKRWGEPFQIQGEVGWREVEWVAAVTRRWPGINWFHFVHPMSWAAAELFGRDLDWWEPQLDINDAVWESLTGLPAALRYDDPAGVGSFATPPIGANDPLLPEWLFENEDGGENPATAGPCEAGSFAPELPSCQRPVRNFDKVPTGVDLDQVPMSSSKQPDLPVDPEAIAVAAGLSVERRRALRKRARRRVRQGRSPSEPEAYLDLLVGTLPRDRLDAAAIEVIEASVAA